MGCGSRGYELLMGNVLPAIVWLHPERSDGTARKVTVGEGAKGEIPDFDRRNPSFPMSRRLLRRRLQPTTPPLESIAGLRSFRLVTKALQRITHAPVVRRIENRTEKATGTNVCVYPFGSPADLETQRTSFAQKMREYRDPVTA